MAKEKIATAMMGRRFFLGVIWVFSELISVDGLIIPLRELTTGTGRLAGR